MPRTGRPPLTEGIVAERIAGYCRRYDVSERNEAGFPAYPAGKRETPQHREWVVLFKAFSRVRARLAGREPAAPSAAAACPTCGRPFATADDQPAAGKLPKRLRPSSR